MQLSHRLIQKLPYADIKQQRFRLSSVDFTHKHSNTELSETKERKTQKQNKRCLFFLSAYNLHKLPRERCVRERESRRVWWSGARLRMSAVRLFTTWELSAAVMKGRTDVQRKMPHIKNHTENKTHTHTLAHTFTNPLPYCRLSNATPIDAVAMVTPYPACPSWCFPQEKMYVCVCVWWREVNVPHVCFALSCAVGCTEEENMAGLEPLSRRPIVCVIVCACVWTFFSVLSWTKHWITDAPSKSELGPD